MAPRWRHDGPTMAPRWPHDGATMASRWPHDGATMASRWRNDGATMGDGPSRHRVRRGASPPSTARGPPLWEPRDTRQA
eukprot:gene5428-biopygen6225